MRRRLFPPLAPGLQHRILLLLLLLLVLMYCCPHGGMAQQAPPADFGEENLPSAPLEDHAAIDRHRHHSLMGPCLDRGQFCEKLKRFCNDFKYQTLVNKECRATCGKC